jgi:predicted transcriptional regulator
MNPLTKEEEQALELAREVCRRIKSDDEADKLLQETAERAFCDLFWIRETIGKKRFQIAVMKDESRKYELVLREPEAGTTDEASRRKTIRKLIQLLDEEYVS